MADSRHLMNNELQHENKYKRAHKQEVKLNSTIELLLEQLRQKYPDHNFIRKNKIHLKYICELGNKKFNQNIFSFEQNKSYLRPDGGIIYIIINNQEYPILIPERKRQGTIDILFREQGKIQKARGNAIERMGKNVLGFQTYFRILGEDIFPFVAFGDGCDFEEGCTIRDRVVAINHFGELNKINVYNVLGLQRGSYYFRYKEWTNEEMLEILIQISNISIEYYLAKYLAPQK